jgi:hypothetical protein
LYILTVASSEEDARRPAYDSKNTPSDSTLRSTGRNIAARFRQKSDQFNYWSTSARFSTLRTLDRTFCG